MKQSTDINLLMTALDNAKAEFDPILKNATNPHFKSKYANLAAVIEATEPQLTKNHIQIMQHPFSRVEGGVTMTGVETVLYHSSGQFISSELLLPIGAADPQKACGAITYARRYAKLAILDLATEDDDGETSAGRGKAQEKKQKAEKAAPKKPEPPADKSAINPPAGAPTFNRQPFYGRAKAISDILGPDSSSKVKAYLLKTTGKDDLIRISEAEWEVALGVLERLDKEKLLDLVSKA